MSYSRHDNLNCTSTRRSFANNVDLRPEFLSVCVLRLRCEGHKKQVAVFSQRQFLAVNAHTRLAGVVIAKIRSTGCWARVHVGDEGPATARGIGADLGSRVEIRRRSIAAIDAIDLIPAMAVPVPRIGINRFDVDRLAKIRGNSAFDAAGVEAKHQSLIPLVARAQAIVEDG